MDEKLIALLERGVTALERIAAAMVTGGHAVPTPREPLKDQVRETLLSKFRGMYVTVDQARDALGMFDASSKAVGQVVAAAGFERRRWSAGVRFAICEPGEACTGAPVVLPENLQEAAEAAKVAKTKNGKTVDARGLIYGAYLMQGVQAKPSQVTEQHVIEVERMFPDLFSK